MPGRIDTTIFVFSPPPFFQAVIDFWTKHPLLFKNRITHKNLHIFGRKIIKFVKNGDTCAGGLKPSIFANTKRGLDLFNHTKKLYFLKMIKY